MIVREHPIRLTLPRQQHLLGFERVAPNTSMMMALRGVASAIYLTRLRLQVQIRTRNGLCRQMLQVSAKIGWEAGIRTPITWSRGGVDDVGGFGLTRFCSENRTDRGAVSGRRRPFRAQSVKFLSTELWWPFGTAKHGIADPTTDHLA